MSVFEHLDDAPSSHGHDSRWQTPPKPQQRESVKQQLRKETVMMFQSLFANHPRWADLNLSIASAINLLLQQLIRHRFSA